jgi:olefin beta-lactone synthetase
MNVMQVLQRTVSERGTAPALIDVSGGRDRVVSFDELEAASAKIAAEIASCGISQGDGMLILHPIAIELYVFLLALFRIGAVGVFLDPSAGRDHVERCCELFPLQGFFGSKKAHLLRWSIPALRRVRFAFCPEWFPGTRTVNFDPPGIKPMALARVEDSDPALITFTSGSTGQPKATCRSHGFLLAQHRALAASIDLRAGARDLTTLPIFVLANLASGVTSILPHADMRAPGKIDAQPVLDQILRQRVATIGASPALIARLTEECKRTGKTLPEVERVFIGGAPVFPSDLRDARAAFPGAEITAVYGSTEAEPMAKVALSTISEEDFGTMQRGGGLLAGAPVAAICLRIIREQWGTPLASLSDTAFKAMTLSSGEVGEIVVSGEHVLSDYLHGEGGSETKFDVEGVRWHRTGDLGRLDVDGRLWLLGRAAAKIKDARGVLYPFAVECAAQQIFGVQRSALVQVGGLRLLAIVGNPQGGTDAVLDALEWAQIDEVRILSAIPMDKRHNAKVDYGALTHLISQVK